MDKRWEWITHKNKKIIYVDYTDLSEEEYFQTVDQAEKEILAQPDNSVLRMSCIHSGHMTEKIKERAKDHKRKVKHKVKAIAAVGLTGIKKTLVRLLYRDIYFADTIEEAKAWLVKQ